MPRAEGLKPSELTIHHTSGTNQLMANELVPLQTESIDLRTACSRVSAAYRRCAPAHRYYVAIKLRTDPLARELYSWCRERGELGVVLDVGCGRGQFSLLAAQVAAVVELQGTDHDEEKIAAARGAVSSFGPEFAPQRFRFSEHDASRPESSVADTIFLFDVLHYLTASEQTALIQSLAKRLRSGGCLLIRETNQSGGGGAWFAALFERVGRFLGFNRGRQLVFREPGVLELELRAQGLEVTRSDARGPLQNELLFAYRPNVS